ncbi:hypothetical protein SGFS_050220 [Streptomyces graminofaciens]|uniref:Ricin B lectin domain-containing protein n=1 Tax=Streptomyces graminofaciens TaxID=68212 RepID=A0ABM9SBZ8_9ACTN|nr:RICIN domain-containing protein [Streptomyces graminofaciens]BBC33728.1 hypothetical protein SGFS_050220 [Streptomyces graminofaciens]
MARSDARLTELLRADTPTVFPALRELRARHHPSVLAYARLCTASEAAARQLAAQVFTTAARETAQGFEPSVPWRHQLLLLAGRSAAAWAGDERAGGLDAGLLVMLNTTGPDGPEPPMLMAFRSLPPRAQGLLWYGFVEREPDDQAAAFLGLTREDVTYEKGPALHTLRQACLRTRLAASDDPRCQDFRRLIEESVRPDTPRHSADLHAHMAHCAHCTGAFEELRALRDAPRAALAEGLLPWGGAAYVRGRESEGQEGGGVGEASAGDAGEGVGEATARDAGGGATKSRRPPSRRFVLTSAVLGVAALALLGFLLFSGDSSSPSPAPAGADAVRTPASPPSVTVPSSPAPSPDPSPSVSRSVESPEPTGPTQSPAPSAQQPGSGYAQVVNVASGLCLDVRGELEKGTDVVTAICTRADTQRWRVDADRGVVQSYADPDFCLDSRGATDDGVGIWECDSVDGDNGRNLRFTVDSRGAIRPAIAPDHAVTPDALGAVSLAEGTGRAGQRWRTGAGPR